MVERDESAPLKSLDEWEEDLLRRYPTPAQPAGGLNSASGTALEAFQAVNPEKQPEQFRNYAAEARPSVREFYRLNHTYQTFDFVQSKRTEFLGKRRAQMGVWEAMEYLNQLVDDSDPDTDLPQIEHLLQTAERMRGDGQPRWFILTGLIHDLGKILCLWGEPQWAVVGDTFPVGCAHSQKIVYPEFFANNPDSAHPVFSTAAGMYEPGAGLDTVYMSWGHDEYLYQVVKDYLPLPALYMIRYHSFYAAHREGEYTHLMNEQDQAHFEWVRAFNPYDLYTKSHARPDVPAIRPYYEELIAEYFPAKLAW